MIVIFYIPLLLLTFFCSIVRRIIAIEKNRVYCLENAVLYRVSLIGQAGSLNRNIIKIYRSSFSNFLSKIEIAETIIIWHMTFQNRAGYSTELFKHVIIIARWISCFGKKLQEKFWFILRSSTLTSDYTISRTNFWNEAGWHNAFLKLGRIVTCM